MQEVYLALSGARAIERSMGVIANNMANSNTPGYRADHLAVAGLASVPDYDALTRSSAEELNVEPPQPTFYTALMPLLSEQTIDPNPGVARNSGLQTDLLIDGQGFFAVQTPQGERYTRAGNFTVGTNGMLTTMNGYPVAGQGSQGIKVNGADFKVRSDGGVYDAKGKQVGTIKIVAFPDARALAKEGASLFKVAGASAQPVVVDRAKVSLKQGWLEESNVQTISELVDMIAAQRMYEAYQKLIRTSDDMSVQYEAALMNA